MQFQRPIAVKNLHDISPMSSGWRKTSYFDDRQNMYVVAIMTATDKVNQMILTTVNHHQQQLCNDWIRWWVMVRTWKCDQPTSFSRKPVGQNCACLQHCRVLLHWFTDLQARVQWQVSDRRCSNSWRRCRNVVCTPRGQRRQLRLQPRVNLLTAVWMKLCIVRLVATRLRLDKTNRWYLQRVFTLSNIQRTRCLSESVFACVDTLVQLQSRMEIS